MNDNIKRDTFIVAGGAVILFFLFQLKSKNTAFVSVDNSPISIPEFNPADFPTSGSMNSFDPSDYFTGGKYVKDTSAKSLSDKYIPLFGFIRGSISNQSAPVVIRAPIEPAKVLYQAASPTAAPTMRYVAPTVKAPAIVLPQPVVNKPSAYVAPVRQPVVSQPIINKPFVVSQFVDYVDNATKYSNNPQPVNPNHNKISVSAGSKTTEFASGATKIFNKYSDGSIRLA